MAVLRKGRNVDSEQIQQWAREAGIGDWAVGIFAEAKNDALQAFATLVRNAALEEAAVKLDTWSDASKVNYISVRTKVAAQRIRSMKS